MSKTIFPSERKTAELKAKIAELRRENEHLRQDLNAAVYGWHCAAKENDMLREKFTNTIYQGKSYGRRF